MDGKMDSQGKIRTLGLVYGNLALGGIQKGASFQIPMFKSWGFRVVVLTNTPASDKDYAVPGIDARVCVGVYPFDHAKRADNIEKAVREHGIDLVIHHDAYTEREPKADIEGAARAGVPVVIFWHSVFSHFFLRKSRQHEARGVFEACRRAAAMITLSKTDEAFFRMLGVPSLAIPYSDPDAMEGTARHEFSKRILWMGRFVELKRPLMAIRIFERVLARCPDAELYVLGEAKPDMLEYDPRPYVAARPVLAKAVHFEGFQKDVRPYLEKCGVGLVTSRFEGYSHAIVEMKMAAMPVVAFDMPYLDTLRSGSGAACVPQEDVEAAAEAVMSLLRDRAEYGRQSELARKSYFEIVSTDQRKSYRRLFDAVESGMYDGFLAIEPHFAHLVVETFIGHADMALRLADRIAREETDRAVRDEWTHDRSYRLGRIITWPYRMAKRFLRRLR